MRRQLALVALLALVFGGMGSSALLARAVAQSKSLSAVQQEKRLGPKPTPEWYWHWLHWRLHDRMGNRLDRDLRPKDAPRLVEHWAWRRLHFFLLARAADGHNGQPTTPPTKPSSGSVHFDAQAKKMSKLYSYETTPGNINTLVQKQTPSVWTCLCFEKNDISLKSDSTYGKAYKTTVPTGDHNPWNTKPYGAMGAAQMSARRSNDLGKWDYYAVAVKVPSWSGPTADLEWADIISLGYQTSSSDQVALGLIGDGKGGLDFQMQQNSGLASTTSTGWVEGSVSYRKPFMPVTYGHWQDFVVGVKWATDNTGAVEVYTRTHGSWRKVFARTNEPTYLYGRTSYGTFARNGSNWHTVIDKLGLYYGISGGITPTETVYESGLTRSSDLAKAKSTLP